MTTREEGADTMKRHTLGTSIDEVIVERVLPDSHRVRVPARVLGYVIETHGPIYVALLGNVYNTAVEVGQCHDLDTAVRLLAEH